MENAKEHKLSEVTDIEWLKERYFSDPKQRMELAPGDVILNQGKRNDRIYYLESGLLGGYNQPKQGAEMELFHTKPGMIAGIYSFFSHNGHSYTTVKALEPSVVYYTQKSQIPDESSQDYCLFLHHMTPVLVNEIYTRQMLLFKSTKERQAALDKLIESEKLATLGQLSAGLAHELNNAIGVIQNKTQWLIGNLRGFFGNTEKNDAIRFFDNGLEKGQSVSTADVRKRKKNLLNKVKMKETFAKRLARMDLTQEELDFLSKRRSESFLNQVAYYWETGQAIHDLGVAAKQTTHVIHSIREMGAPTKKEITDCSLKSSFEKTLTLLHNMIKKMEVNLEIEEDFFLEANEGKLIQAWLNLIKNAAESLVSSNTENPRIDIITQMNSKDFQVIIRDNGPGISKELLPKIFQPNVTTKVGGISFGLGLGLSIVQKIITDINGTIEVQSEPGNTEFIIQLPKS